MVMRFQSPLVYMSKSKKKDKDQESIQPSTTRDPGYNMGKEQEHNVTQQTRAKRSALSLQPFPKRQQ